MNEFVHVAALVMAFVSSAFMMARLIPSLWSSKGFNFLCGESAFATMGLYAALVVVGTSWFAPFWVAIWFIAGSVKFAFAAWLPE